MAEDLRHRIAEAIASVADFSIIAEWICCDPINPDHDLCVKGDTARQMLRAVLADDPEVLFVPSGVVDAVMAVVTPLITDLPVVGLDDPCVECREPVEPGDRVSWRLRFLPQGLIHEECK